MHCSWGATNLGSMSFKGAIRGLEIRSQNKKKWVTDFYSHKQKSDFYSCKQKSDFYLCQFFIPFAMDSIDHCLGFESEQNLVFIEKGFKNALSLSSQSDTSRKFREKYQQAPTLLKVEQRDEERNHRNLLPPFILVTSTCE